MKSRESGLLPLLVILYKEAAQQCRASKADIARDLETIGRRCKHEGDSFFTITLPDFAKAVEHSLEQSMVDHGDFQGWKRYRCLPAFLRGFTCQVFSVSTGRLLDEPSKRAVACIRQICYAYKKLSLPCTDTRSQRALDGYVETERFVQGFRASEDKLARFEWVSRLLWGDIFGDFDHHNLAPKHGPGAVVEKVTGNTKWLFRQWHERLQPYFPVDEYAYVNVGDFVDREDELTLIPEEAEAPVKVTLVPKTLKGPRIIAIEPVCMQYAQQALAEYLISRLESHWITGGHINFKDQSVNQRLAMTASSDGKMATLDLSDASDRVSLSLVQLMLRSTPDLLGALEASRSKAAKLPSGTVIPLSKFASMGSAVCFPIEAMTFFTILVCALLEARALSVSFGHIFSVAQSIYVYGDDLVVPADEAQAVIDSLSAYGMKVNSSKSFRTGRFRESCGVDAFMGYKVTPVYVRHVRPNDRGDVSALLSAVATANQFYEAGYIDVANHLKHLVERILGPLPQVAATSPGLGWSFLTSNNGSIKTRWNKAIHCQQVLTWTATPVYYRDGLDGPPALLKFLVSALRRTVRTLPMSAGVDEKHLERSPRHGAASIKRRWVVPY